MEAIHSRSASKKSTPSYARRHKTHHHNFAATWSSCELAPFSDRPPASSNSISRKHPRGSRVSIILHDQSSLASPSVNHETLVIQTALSFQSSTRPTHICCLIRSKSHLLPSSPNPAVVLCPSTIHSWCVLCSRRVLWVLAACSLQRSNPVKPTSRRIEYSQNAAGHHCKAVSRHTISNVSKQIHIPTSPPPLEGCSIAKFTSITDCTSSAQHISRLPLFQAMSTTP